MQRRKDRAAELSKRRIAEAESKKKKEEEIIRLRPVTTAVQAAGYCKREPASIRQVQRSILV